MSSEKSYMEKWVETKDKVPLRKGSFIGEEDEKFYIVSENDELYELSALVYYIWLISDGEHTVEQLVDRMSEDIGVNKEDLVEPFLVALESLVKAGLIIYKT